MYRGYVCIFKSVKKEQWIGKGVFLGPSSEGKFFNTVKLPLKREGRNQRSTQDAKCTMCHWQLRDNPHLWLMRWTCCAVSPVMVSVLIWDGRIWYLLTTTTWLQKVGHEVQSLVQKLRYLCANPNDFCDPSNKWCGQLLWWDACMKCWCTSLLKSRHGCKRYNPSSLQMERYHELQPPLRPPAHSTWMFFQEPGDPVLH